MCAAERYGELRPATSLKVGPLLLQPFRARQVQGLVVAHDGGDGDSRRFLIVALDPLGINMPPVFERLDEADPRNTCFEFEITARNLDVLPKTSRGALGPVRLEPVADRWSCEYSSVNDNVD